MPHNYIHKALFILIFVSSSWAVNAQATYESLAGNWIVEDVAFIRLEQPEAAASELSYLWYTTDFFEKNDVWILKSNGTLIIRTETVEEIPTEYGITSISFILYIPDLSDKTGAFNEARFEIIENQANQLTLKSLNHLDQSTVYLKKLEE